MRMEPGDFGAALGSRASSHRLQISIFVPDRDRNGVAIEQDKWVDEIARGLAEIFGGATAYPPARGVWRDDGRGGSLLDEITTMVFTYVNEADFTGGNADSLRRLVHRFGREAGQGEVGVVIGDAYHPIAAEDFDPS